MEVLIVEVINHTPDVERSIATAARLCYARVGARDLKESLSDDKVSALINSLLKSGHLSAFEHASFTFAIEGVSRALTHQLVRHRLASYNQQSQRYVRFEDGLEVVEPATIAENAELSDRFNSLVDDITTFYKDALAGGIPAEDARYILPNATETKIVVTMNVRELLHFFELRCCKRAQWEIRELALEMLRLVRPYAPTIFADAGAGCVRGRCTEGERTCGNPYVRVVR